MANFWRGKAPARDLYVYLGEDLDLGGRFTRDRQPWIPPAGTTVFFRVLRDGTQVLQLDCVVVDDTFSVHIEATQAETMQDGDHFWFYVQTPDTPDGNPKLISTGKVKRNDAA